MKKSRWVDVAIIVPLAAIAGYASVALSGNDLMLFSAGGAALGLAAYGVAYYRARKRSDKL